MAVIDPNLISHARQESKRIEGIVSALPASPTPPQPRSVLTNFDLLLKTLDVFFRRNKNAPYLPGTITTAIAAQLTLLNTELGAISTGADDPAAATAPPLLLAVLEKMDALYALCLQYGLISFGFTAKQAQEHVNEIAASVADVMAAKANAESRIAAISKTSCEDVQSASVAASSEITQQLESARQDVATIKSKASEVAIASAAITAELERVQKLGSQVEGIVATMSSLSTTAAADKARIVDEAKVALTSVQASESQISTLSATAKAASQMVADSRASVDAQLESIKAFYVEIASHKQSMLDIQTEAATTAASLKQTTTANLARYSEATAEITRRNHELNKEITAHLAKAVGITMFTAFDKRRELLQKQTTTWRNILGATTALAAGVGCWFAWEVAGHKMETVVLLSRLIIAAPIAFAIIFAARQYTRERRAEEEYAFKSSISVSLEPYRDLIEKIRKGAPEADTEFVKKLMAVIFDNPTKRLYPTLPPQGGADGKDEHASGGD